MSSSASEIEVPLARSVRVTSDALQVHLADGRTITVPLAWYPRLAHAAPSERRDWRLIARGRGIHWESIDEDVSIEGLLAGRPSGESRASFERWLRSRHGRTLRSAATRRRSRSR